ncbi:MAG TPA: hypothetical protein VEK73_13980 [Xanthobacteraceae bacterium]|nr:hypothetical protein [Xanthobacteraceae bacterium]
MWRSIAIAALVYAYGHPNFDGYRPAGLDRPLQAFYVEVNKAALTGRQALGRVDDDRVVRYLKSYVDTVEAELRSAN